MIDFNDYVGIPWECGGKSMSGADCWGLICIVYKDLFHVKLGHFSVSEIDSTKKTTTKIEFVRDNSLRWVKVDDPLLGDVIMMFSRLNGKPEHVGVYTNHNQILHSLTREKGQSEIHPMKLLNKLFKRLEFYRYAP